MIMIEIKEFETDNPYSASEYPSSGFWEVKGIAYYVNQKSNTSMMLEATVMFQKFINAISKLTTNKKDIEPQPIELIAEELDPVVSEEFFFKTIAMIHNGEKFKDIK